MPTKLVHEETFKVSFKEIKRKCLFIYLFLYINKYKLIVALELIKINK